MNGIYSQNITVFNIDKSNYPNVSAKFFAYDKDGNQIVKIVAPDIEIFENSQPRTVNNVSCPSPKPPQAISSVLTIDVSGSMAQGDRMRIAIEAAEAWVKAMPLDVSECAVTSFDQENYLNQDFTNDVDNLIMAISALHPKGGTDYETALNKPVAGSLKVTKAGRFKKVVVFLTDGTSANPPNVQEIINEANSQNCKIYSVVVGMKCPAELKEISLKTGGFWFEDINSIRDAISVYRLILHESLGGEHCNIEWTSGVTCFQSEINAEFNLLPYKVNTIVNYEPVDDAVAELQIEPSSIRFIKALPGIKRDTTIRITAKNTDFNVTKIIPSNASFMINPNSFSLQAGESMDLELSFIPVDSGYVSCQFTFESEPCIIKYYAKGGFPGKIPAIQTLAIIQPNGDEVFVVGADTLIQWDGVFPEDTVRIEYSTNNGINWILIAENATGLSYNWRVPHTPSNKCLARVTAKSDYILSDMVLIPKGSFVMGNTGSNIGTIGTEWESPAHPVTISKSFLMSKHEISQRQYYEVMRKNPSLIKDVDLPVESVSWYDAILFCNEMSKYEGFDTCYVITGNVVICNWDADGYRLPTEAEWEYACKAGSTSDYYNGDLTHAHCLPVDDKLAEIAWYCGNSDGELHLVSGKTPNAYGLYDMSGNVWEWCWDTYQEYSEEPAIDPKGPDHYFGSQRILRGGAYSSRAVNCRSSYRLINNPNARLELYGFRVVRVN